MALQRGDVVKLHMGAHIDGFASVAAETLVVGATPEDPVTGKRADVLNAAWHAAEVAKRMVKAGNKNWSVTEAVDKTTAAWGCKAVEGASRGDAGSLLSRIYASERHAVVPADSKRH